MSSYKFKCILLSDIIVSQNPSSEGGHETLDFIPGSNFLGLAAASLYDQFKAEGIANLVFHSGMVRFGDAHPGTDGIRAVRVPASMYYPKLKTPEEECYIYHLHDRSKDLAENGQPIQLKQCRDNFYIFSGGTGKYVEVHKTFSIKSAYNRELRKSKDSQMFGYQSMSSGTVLYFEIDIAGVEPAAENAIFNTIVHALEGEKRIGRSKTAQYGSVLIQYLPEGFQEIPSSEMTGQYATVYADGRLIFTDIYGQPKMLPDAEDLGFSEESRILWDKSQIRTFRYAPWNYKRQCRDSDRCGIEKGSVFVVESPTSPCRSCYVGQFKSEGFGKVIYNPDFLTSVGGNGIAKYRLSSSHMPKGTALSTAAEDSISEIYLPMIKYLSDRQQREINSERIYSLVNRFMQEHATIFTAGNEKFASQWGAIRMLAEQFSRLSPSADKNIPNLYDALFSGQEENGHAKGYLMHGTALDKWKKNNRVAELKAFIGGLIAETSFSETEKLQAVINLSSEMSKKSK